VNTPLSERVDLKELERKIYLSYHKDGLVDIFLGIGLIVIGIILHPILGETVPTVAMVMIMLFVFVYAALKREITIPRIGYVEFAPKRRTRFALLILIIVLITNVPLLLVLMLTVGQQISPIVFDFVISFLLVILGFFGTGLFVLIGILSEISRFFGYAVATLILFIISHFLFLHFALPMIGVGVIITIVGFFQLGWFLRKYPKSNKRDIAAEEW
jgi:hypothetical protein